MAAIAGLGHYLPETRVTNAALCETIDSSTEWIEERTGIVARRWAAPDEATSDLAVKACLAALADAGEPPTAIDLLLVATATSDMPVPSTASLVQARLGEGSIPAMDVGAACSGFLYALHVAAAAVDSGMHERVLVVGAETLSRFLNRDDRQTAILFGDGAGAAVVRRSGFLALEHSALHTEPGCTTMISIPAGGSRAPTDSQTLNGRMHCVHLKGQEVFRAAVRSMRVAVGAMLDAVQLQPEDIDLLIPHQANARIIRAVAEDLGIPPTRTAIDLAETGNTSAASIPIALARRRIDEGIPAGARIVLVAFGAGGSVACQLWRA